MNVSGDASDVAVRACGRDEMPQGRQDLDLECGHRSRLNE
jgi:hypothetical protein